MKVRSAVFRLAASVFSFAIAAILFSIISGTGLNTVLSGFGVDQTLEQPDFKNTILFQVQTYEPKNDPDVVIASYTTLYNEGLDGKPSKSIVSFGIAPTSGVLIMLSDVSSAPESCYSENDVSIVDIKTRERILNTGKTKQSVWMFNPKKKMLFEKEVFFLEILPSNGIVVISCLINDVWEDISFSDRRLSLNFLLPGDLVRTYRNGKPNFFRYDGLWKSKFNRPISPVQRVEWNFNIRDGRNYIFRGGSLSKDQDISTARGVFPSSSMSVEWEVAWTENWKELIWILIGAFIAIGLTMIGKAVQSASSDRSI